MELAAKTSLRVEAVGLLLPSKGGLVLLSAADPQAPTQKIEPAPGLEHPGVLAQASSRSFARTSRIVVRLAQEQFCG